MPRDFRRIAIVNRGEAATRFLHAAREDSLESGRPLTSIALYTDPDRRSLFVREADEAISLGEPFVTDPSDGRRKSSYLDYERLARALTAARAEAVWVGWGLVAEHAAFADLCAEMGIVFLGPSGDVMRQLGDKIGSKRLAEEAGVPVAPWSGGPVEDVDQARRHAAEIGYPLMVKATAGGGGRGIRRVDREADLADAFAGARSEGFKSFGDPTVFLERRVRGGRHVEVQVIGDEHGTVWALGVRDCSVQRRHQKLIEETPSPALSDDEDAFLRGAAARLAQSAGYTGAGTVEFLFEPESRRFSFLEVNARLQVEHPVTELVTGVDLVRLQLHVGRGLPLPEGGPPPARGHAVEARLNAEDPERDFAPSPGRLEVFRPARGPGVRIDSGVEEGDTIPSEFDSMIAKVITWGATREEAFARLRRALGETAVVIRGGASNKAFLQELLARPEMASGDFDTEWLDRLGAAGERPPGRAAAVALLQAAVDSYEAAVDVERTRFWSTAARGRPDVGEEGGRSVELRFRGRPYAFRVDRTGAGSYRLRHGTALAEIEVERLGGSERRLSVAGRVHRVFSVLQGVDQLVEVDGVPHRVSHGDAGVVRSPAPAVVVSLAVAEGDAVEPGQRLAVIEAMKMETAIVAEFAGRVAKLAVRPNVQVAAGAPLMVIEPTALAPGAGRAAAGGHAVSFAELAAPPERDDDRLLCLANLARLRQLYLGWDSEPAEPARIIAQHGILCAALDAGDVEVRHAEDGLVAAFVDVAALFGRRRDDEEIDEAGRTSEHYLFAYLRDLGARGKGLPGRFLERLRRALAHYGIDDLTPSAELREALFRLSKAHRGLAARQAPVLAVLDRRLSAAAELRGEADDIPALLRRLVEVSRGRYAPIHDLAREVLYRFTDEAFLDGVRESALATAAEDLDRLLAGAVGEERERRLASLLACPQPLQALFARRFADAGDEGRRLMLELLVRRAYGLTGGQEVETRRFRGHAFAAATQDEGDGPVHLVATNAPWAEFPRVAELAVKRVKKAPRREAVVTDFFLHREEPVADRDAAAEEARALLVEADLPQRLERATVMITSAPGGAGQVDFFTFHPDGKTGAWHENRLLRGLHPSTAERLQLWRLAGFELERLPAADDVYAFRGSARDNPGDERLFLAAEVRDLTPQPGDNGSAVRFPHLERVYHEALAVVRRFQSRLPPERRLQWNRITLYVRPPLGLAPSTLRSLVRRLAPAAEGLGLQKVVVFGRLARGEGPPRPTVLEVSQPAGRGMELRFREPGDEPIETLSPYQSQVVRLRRRGLVPPYELVRLLAPPADASEGELPPGEFIEHDLGEVAGHPDVDRAVPVDRPPGGNRANLVFGVVRSFTATYPQGMARVLVASDPGRDMGALAEPECRRLLAALDLAEELGVPLEWFATSAGAKISMDSGTENMDWIARVLRRIVRFTQDGGEINLVVPGVNVGAQPYWNAEATMLMHTRGVLIMTTDGALVLTGKQALDYSGGVSAEDNQGIGGYERIMGPNGQAQYAARDLADACRILLAYYERTWVAPGERFPRRRPTSDPLDRNVCTSPHGGPHGGDFALVGEIFSDETNPGRKKPFDIRQVMAAVIDQDRPPLERWPGMADAEVAVVWDAFLGGQAASIVGFESRPLPRLGFHPADGPDQWTAGTLFPQASKKVARAINAASGRRPVVFLANLSGFDGSPESMRRLQLEHGAEIGRAVVNFDGPLVFCVISRYHGGAFVVFSNSLNDNFQAAALTGSYASVIGGAPAAAVVFAREVEQRAKADPRVAALAEEAADATGPPAARLKNRMEQVLAEVRSEKLGEVAAEFDRVHDVERARRVGSVDAIIDPWRLRPWLIEAVERGMARAGGAATDPRPAGAPAAKGS